MTSSEAEAEATPKRPKMDQAVRQQRIKELNEDIKDCQDSIRFKEKRRHAAENEKRYKTCEDITLELNVLLKKEGKSKWNRNRKLVQSRQSRSGSSPYSSDSEPPPKRPHIPVPIRRLSWSSNQTSVHESPCSSQIPSHSSTASPVFSTDVFQPRASRCLSPNYSNSMHSPPQFCGTSSSSNAARLLFPTQPFQLHSQRSMSSPLSDSPVSPSPRQSFQVCRPTPRPASVADVSVAPIVIDDEENDSSLESWQPRNGAFYPPFSPETHQPIDGTRQNPTQQPPSKASRPGQDQEAMLSPSGSHLPPDIVDGTDCSPRDRFRQPPCEASHSGRLKPTMLSCSETPRSRLSALAKGTPHPRNPTQQPPSEASRPGQDQEDMLSPSGSHLPPEIVDGTDCSPRDRSQQPPSEASHSGRVKATMLSCSETPHSHLSALAKGTPHPRNPTQQPPSEASRPGKDQEAMLSPSGSHVPPAIVDGTDCSPRDRFRQPPCEASHSGR